MDIIRVLKLAAIDQFQILFDIYEVKRKTICDDIPKCVI